MPHIPKRVVNEVLTRDGHKCVYCRCPLSQGNFSIDHFNPKVSGGGNEAANLVAACIPCNNAKGRRVFGTIEDAAMVVLFTRGVELSDEPSVPFVGTLRKWSVKPSKKRKSGRKVSDQNRRTLALWRGRNREKVNAVAKEFYNKVKEKRSAQALDRYHSNREEIIKRQHEAKDRRRNEGVSLYAKVLLTFGVVMSFHDPKWRASRERGFFVADTERIIRRKALKLLSHDEVESIRPFLKVYDRDVTEKELEACRKWLIKARQSDYPTSAAGNGGCATYTE